MVGLNGRLALAIAAAAFGSAFQHGYNTGVLNAPQELICQFINETSQERFGNYMDETQLTMIWSWIVSIYCAGGIIGAMMTGIVADRLGRKVGLLWNNITILIGVILIGFAKPCGYYEMLIVGRFFVVRFWVLEVSSVRQQCGHGSFLAPSSPAIFQVCTLPICPESPKFTLLNKGKEIEAQRALTWFRGTIEVHEELDEMRAEYEQMKAVPKPSLKEMFTVESLRMPLIISCMMMVAQQLSGINAVIFFSTKIFQYVIINFIE
ncbi:Solute carrier family 2, facilitated glucose transporter member 1 [Orchesella cincta]|uniref:Solute carrier family 2, facilitated glucose transporter member 1 n=1 Tax=Orchesella cincta TaxID=48709 RepID=A0A1D2MTQ0_ORCCI|nr:Solute carrier family 2, facilitated glucose transporter member 1 [Orchesella cincta]